jgi:hypothetical protein
MASTKAIEFIGSKEYFEIIKNVGELFNINWGDKRMPRIIALVNNIVRYNQTSETPVKELIKKWLNFLNEEEMNNLYQFLAVNFLPKVKELWQEEEISESEGEGEETFEEKERRYLELMKTIIQYPQKPKEEQERKEETKKEFEEYRTITFEPKEEHKKETEESLPETTIVITKKKEEEKPKEEGLLDLSKL